MSDRAGGASSSSSGQRPESHGRRGRGRRPDAVEARTPLPEPVPSAVFFQDPRSQLQGDEPAFAEEAGLIGFYYPGREEAWDTLCGSGFLGNFWNLGSGALQLEAPCEPGRIVSFANAEAAFQALKFWPQADAFSGLSGNEAFRLKRSLAGNEDFTYGGFGSNWAGMLAVLSAKFRPGAPWTESLLKTGDAFLLEHNSVAGRDKVWSDNHDGEGTNWLGMQLMLVRDRLSGQSSWTAYISRLVDLRTGQPRGQAEAIRWQKAVRSSNRALKAALSRPGTADAAALLLQQQQQHKLQPQPLSSRQPSQQQLQRLPTGTRTQDSWRPAPLALEGPEEAGATDSALRLAALVIPGEGQEFDDQDAEELQLVTTKLRVPLHRGFSWMDSEDKQVPIPMAFLAQARKPPPEPEPEEEDLMRAAPTIQEEEEEPLTSAERYALLVKTEGDRMSMLDFACMARLKAWDTCADGYSLQEMMALARWLEKRLAPEPPTVPVWRRLLTFLEATRERRRWAVIGALAFIVVALVLIGVATGLAWQFTKKVGARSSGVMTSMPTPSSEGQSRLASVGQAVHLHGLLEYPSLRTEDLRRVQDVVFTHRGDFHFYRVAGVTQVMGGGVRMVAEDGTLIRVSGNRVALGRPWTREEAVDANDLYRETGGDSWASAGAFRALAPLAPLPTGGAAESMR